MEFEDYQVGDIVECTRKNGTTLRGEIYRKLEHNLWVDSEGIILVRGTALKGSRLVERPFKINTKPGTVYGDPKNRSLRVVKMRESGDWLGRVPGEDYHWHRDTTVETLVVQKGWVEMDFEGNPI